MPMRIQNYGDWDGDRSGHHPPNCTCYGCNEAKAKTQTQTKVPAATGTPSGGSAFRLAMVTVAALILSALAVLLVAACSALPEGADAGRADSEPTPGAATGNAEPRTPSERDINRAVDATLDADAQRRATRVARQTVTARVATARAPTPTITPPGLPSLAGEAHDCFMERPEADREATIDDLVRYIRWYEDARAMGKRAVFHHRDRFIKVLSGWDREGQPGITFMMEALCPGGDFTYPPLDEQPNP